MPESSLVPVRHRSWDGLWTEVECAACGRRGQRPRPEFPCGCGALLRLVPAVPGPAQPPPEEEGPPDDGAPAERPLVEGPLGGPGDAVARAARFLRRLGFREVRGGAAPRAGAGVDLRGPAVVAQVNSSAAPTGERAIETLWLHGLVEPAVAVAFSVPGYEPGAVRRAGVLGLPLFALGPAGGPRPLNAPAEALIRDGAREEREEREGS
ncbi:hypothetical protein RM780_02110 [Streptomyces sp. DSM 44917]|uniref:Restriction endonuclease type IV Mrr domain-containing protein n=1 Tax=Streptomyces boetiae TaxID=3075541 RepID=A0ABU2L2M5_9ACTN|nr:hypothetical protein [Streptomyces sp. DSM 44917]MDT0305757.1 hypothetical protein [Streptomyces sp. DSM 44917]